MKKKLQSARGETLVEVLACILICALSVALLAGAVTVSVSIDRRAQKMDTEYYEALSNAEAQNPGDHLKELFSSDVSKGVAISVIIRQDDPYRTPIKVYFYGNDSMFSFAPLPPEGGGP